MVARGASVPDRAFRWSDTSDKTGRDANGLKSPKNVLRAAFKIYKFLLDLRGARVPDRKLSCTSNERRLTNDDMGAKSPYKKFPYSAKKFKDVNALNGAKVPVNWQELTSR